MTKAQPGSQPHAAPSPTVERKEILLDSPEELFRKEGKVHLRIDSGDNSVRLSVNSEDGTTSHKLKLPLAMGRQLRVTFTKPKNAQGYDMVIGRGATGLSVSWQGFQVEDAKKISMSPPGIWKVVNAVQEAAPKPDRPLV